MRSSQKGQLIYHNRSSADFGIYVEFPLTMPAPQLDATVTHINGRNGDLLQTYQSFKNITLTANITVFKPKQYVNLYQLQRAINDWLVGYDYDYLKFSDNPDWLWEAIVTTPPVLTPLIETHAEEELTGTITFDCKPLMYRTEGIHWQQVGNIDLTNQVNQTTVYNQTNMDAMPDWHIKTDGQASGNWAIVVNGNSCVLNNIEDEVYIDGENCQAYNGEVNLNSSVQFYNNDAPRLVSGKNTIEIRGDHIGLIEYRPNWRRLA
jgi:predicted phage tail component-like protein